MRRSHRWFCLAALLAGCGTEEYTKKFSDSLVQRDYDDKVNAVLGPSFENPELGISFRLPKDFPDQPLPQEQIPPDIAAMLDTGERAKFPVRLVVATGAKNPTKVGAVPIESIDAFVKHLLVDAERRERWLGPGAKIEGGLQLEERALATGPKLERRAAPPTVAAKITTIEQVAAAAQGDNRAAAQANGGPQNFLWVLYFFEQDDMFAMIAFRFRKEDYVATFATVGKSTVSVSEAVDIALSRTRLEKPASAEPAAEGKEESSDAPAKESGVSKPAKRRAG